ncbi:hypothetical protein BDV38DRAFT_292243 [Aspergillus pseudotamarii]|uniref:Zn(2)-C6 fungal-type domain-containing protein n=1 Tax=Aspergillus pseudotamarii TaxID=132259 RepID=A0A5N6SVK6_ASPPS|nr:uncharacterized protein BDV38DRAFT_292243 [Aspergillus pseudotamarii]KAE8138685.1 hypothetical protein BDV38DRAFT_292243 [Aspergillus pseudotamarii]
METYNTQLPARKLKDSCDVCSASKLRCDKQKPTCSRCANLNRPCTYSPARRGGRPHRVRRKSSQSQSQSQAKTSKQCLGAPETNSLNSYLVEPTGVSGQTDSEMSCDNGWFPSTHTINHPQDNQLQPAEITSSPCNMVSMGHKVDTTETDCTKAALSIVEQLEITKGRCRSTAPTHSGSGLTATEACQRLLTILMCPCSEQANVALLVASGCISLMDAVHCSTGADSDGGSVSLDVSSSDGRSMGNGSWEQDILIWSRPQSSSRSLAGDSQSQVGDLSKIARLILQFTDRYSQDTKGGPRWEHTTWVVAPVVALLRSRLQYVTQGVARRLVF